MKFSVFADFHYYPGKFMGGSVEALKKIQDRAERENVDFIIHAGDLCHGPSTVPEFVELYNSFHIPSYNVLGNHDTDKTDYKETLVLYNMPDGHYYFDNGGYRFIVCDTNYYEADGEYIHYSLGNYYGHEDTRENISPEQLVWLKESIVSSPYPCILFSHSSFEREADGVRNADKVHEIINEANRKKAGSVLLCINGHHHTDYIRILDGVCYLDLNSTSYQWLPEKHSLYSEALCKEYALLNHTVVYTEPVHAIITLEGNTLTIDGMEGEMFMGVSREDTGNGLCDRAGRATVPKVQSAKITLG